MNIIEDLQWHVQPSPMPEVGDSRTVLVSRHAVQPGAVQHLLWVPPFSERNGWDAQPSDIALSQVVTARLSRTANLSSDARIECAALILERVSLLEACDAAADDAIGDPALLANLQSPVFWDHVRWSGAAQIGGMTFLECAAGEATLTLLFTPRNGTCSVRYLQLHVDGWSSAALGCWQLNDDVQRIFDRHLAAAATLNDTRVPQSSSSGV